MTWAMHCIGLLELGYNTEAAGYFTRAYQTQQPPFMVWTETVTGGTPNFITGYANHVVWRHRVFVFVFQSRPG